MDKSQPALSSHTENASPGPSSVTASTASGRVAGGKYLEGVNESSAHDGPLQTVDFDLPVTVTQRMVQDGNQYIVLDFVPGDKENPFNWDPKYKAFISCLLCLMTLFIGLATTAYSSGISDMASDLGTSTEIAELGLFLFNFTCALAPLFLAPFCELAGRRVVYTGAYFCFAIMFIGLALGKNIGTILVCRALLGLFGCVGTILVGGTFGDMYRPEDRAIPVATFSFIAIFGTVGAPIYAGFIDQALGWRWVEGIQGLANIPLGLVILFFLPETRGSVALGKRAKALRTHTGDDRYVTENDLEAPSLKTMLHNSSKGWNEGVSGLPYIALCLGTTMGFGLNFFQIRKYESLVQIGEARPEARLYGALYGAVWLPIGLFIYSFTQYADLPWIAPVIALVLIAIGIFFIFESCYSFTSDCYGESSSSAIAGQGFMRNTLGAVSPLFASQFFHNVGSQYAGLILALIATALTLIPYVLFWYGPQLRARSKLASLVVHGDGEKKGHNDSAGQGV
ncbi:hypothetical protein CAN33_0013285 [Aspergillus niger]|uniref:Major facilitator superfamily (MFS) profile domain-containing protein n=1 Tax=Aspergillus niger TaxID=5061 RepID=A0A505HQW4_ASPNG|nr:hypothetical protein CAN33_0013285 [Aspergillus niger]